MDARPASGDGRREACCWRSSNGYLTAGQDGQYLFSSVVLFALGEPSFFSAAIDRTALPNIQQPDSNRTYKYGQDFLFAQDTYKLTPRLTVNYGVRYEFYGGPENTGSTKDALVQLGSGQHAGAAIGGRVAGLAYRLRQPAALRIRATISRSGWARPTICSAPDARCCAAASARSIDRPFDNLWENVRDNNLILPLLKLPPGTTNFLAPVSSVLQTFQGQTLASTFPDLTLVDPNLRNGRVKSYFAGVQQRITDNLTLEVNGLGAYGRGLITTDVINRSFSTLAGRYNNNLPDIAYRANQGFSDYNALTAVVRYRTSRGIVQGSYTWSHSIDNQSDPLIGDFFNLTFTSIQTGGNLRAALDVFPAVQSERGSRQFRFRSAAESGDFLLLESARASHAIEGRDSAARLDRRWACGFPRRIALHRLRTLTGNYRRRVYSEQSRECSRSPARQCSRIRRPFPAVCSC